MHTESLQNRIDVKVGERETSLRLIVAAQLCLAMHLKGSVRHLRVQIHKQQIALRVGGCIHLPGGLVCQVQVRQVKICLDVRIFQRPIAVRFEREQTADGILWTFSRWMCARSNPVPCAEKWNDSAE